MVFCQSDYRREEKRQEGTGHRKIAALVFALTKGAQGEQCVLRQADLVYRQLKIAQCGLQIAPGGLQITQICELGLQAAKDSTLWSTNSTHCQNMAQ
jgi:hypothetical protein